MYRYTLAGEVDDCGPASASCQLVLGASPISGPQGYTQYFRGSIFGAAIFTDTALDSHPDFADVARLRTTPPPKQFAHPWRRVYTGRETTVTFGGVAVFSQYFAYLSASTGAGEGLASNISEILTASARPAGVGPPVVTARGADGAGLAFGAEIRWAAPAQLNGELVGYQLQEQGTDPAGNVSSRALYSGKQPAGGSYEK